MKKSKQTILDHPCLSCGACCAFFRVSFWAHELAPDGKWKVPLDFVENPPPNFTENSLLNLKGTTKKSRPSCYALKGKIGQNASCQIYQNRPSPCRDFTASYEDGYKNPRCDDARRAHGLPPLTKSSYPNKDKTEVET